MNIATAGLTCMAAGLALMAPAAGLAAPERTWELLSHSDYYYNHFAKPLDAGGAITIETKTSAIKTLRDLLGRASFRVFRGSRAEVRARVMAHYSAGDDCYILVSQNRLQLEQLESNGSFTLATTTYDWLKPQPADNPTVLHDQTYLVVLEVDASVSPVLKVKRVDLDVYLGAGFEFTVSRPRATGVPAAAERLALSRIAQAGQPALSPQALRTVVCIGQLRDRVRADALDDGGIPLQIAAAALLGVEFSECMPPAI